jgi:hypothetical protein
MKSRDQRTPLLLRGTTRVSPALALEGELIPSSPRPNLRPSVAAGGIGVSQCATRLTDVRMETTDDD